VGESAGKVALFITDLTGGGAERVMINLADGLVRLGREVDMVLVKAEGAMLANVPKGVNIVDLKAPHAMLSAPALAKYIDAEKPVAVLAALNQPNVAAVWAKRLSRHKPKIVISIHNTLSVEAGEAANWRVRLMPAFVRQFFGWADAIVAVSNGVADDFVTMTGIRRDRVEAIYNPVVSQEMIDRAQETVDDPWFASGEPPVVVAVGKLHPQKDYVNLLNAFAAVRRGREARLLILGEGQERAELEALIGELGLTDDVRMPGFVGNPFAYMNKSAVFVLSSRWEGLPTVLIEALACGTPVVSTDCPSGPREILDGGRWGKLVPVDNAAALADAISSTLDVEKESPPRESWEPFERGRVAELYSKVLS